MARNRRNSTSMKFAVGHGCFLFLVLVLCVGFSVTKIIVGSEYVSKCPSKEMIPVYIIVSGCLPVLLSVLRQPYDSGPASEKERWSMKITLVTTVVGVMVNLAWLVAGTYLVVTTWSGNICNIPTPKGAGTSALPKFTTTPTPNGSVQSKYLNNQRNLLQSATDFPITNATVVNIQDDKHAERNQNQYEGVKKDSQNIYKTDRKIIENAKLVNTTLDENSALQSKPTEHTDEDVAEKDPIFKDEEGKIQSDEGFLNAHGNDKNANDKIHQTQGNKDEIMKDDTVSKIVTKIKNNNVSTKRTTDVGKSGDQLTIQEIRVNKAHSESVDSSLFSEKSSQDTLCITCDIHILRFSLAVVVIDWVCVIFGIIYFCHFVYHRFSSIKDQFLLINA
ncbi:uncharacterized protein LOC123535088 [Mercenaria mercenaria]|uniref:uncharacterized protein LOC123535088 n=1 Tax=Mercenaria mercenaria TaxID=6596 RepID=UPI00234E693E|nr:uncharacterized protein LOC123535088 [Mercenaria mercenaria]